MVRTKRLGARIRCAIYTRKSSDEGLEQEFNSLHAQREACESYIASQRHEGWYALPAKYDDGGHSGGTMNRPALQRLLSDVTAGKVDIVVVYKIDRLTRSLLDFAKIVETFDAKRVSFVSVTQAFNTTTSMGRLTLNVLLSFAQFEREVTSERIRDKIAASKKKGMWMGGAVPLGYDAIDRKLKINAEEAKTVRHLFALYLELGSVRKLQEETHRLGLKTKVRTLADGRRQGGTDFSRGHLYRILSSQIYLGRIPHRQTSYDGEHDAIIEAEMWDKVQAQSQTNAGRKRGRTNATQPSLLAGLLFTAEGVPFTPSHAVNHGRRYRYYVERPSGTSQALAEKRGWRLPAHEIEQLVLTQISAFLKDSNAVLGSLPADRRSPNMASAVLKRSALLAQTCSSGSVEDQLSLITSLVRRVSVADKAVMITIGRCGLTAHLLDQPVKLESSEALEGPINLEVPMKLRRRGVEAKLIVPGEAGHRTEPDPVLVKLVMRAHDWFGRIVRGEADGFGDIAKSEGVDRSYVTRVVNLAFLSPEITKAILEGDQPTELTAKRLLKSAARLPLSWVEQKATPVS